MSKTTRIISIVLQGLVSAMMVLSAFMKLTHAEALVEGFKKIGLADFITAIGLIELTAVILLWIPKTKKVGFLLICSYLGGAIVIELGGGHFPTAAVLLTIYWIAMFLRERQMFLPGAKTA
jgi:hypothetical protein